MIKLKTNLKAACCAQAAATVLSKRLCSVGLGYRPSHGASARQSDSVAATVTVPVAAAAVTVTVTRAGQLPPPTLPCGNSSGLRALRIRVRGTGRGGNPPAGRAGSASVLHLNSSSQLRGELLGTMIPSPRVGTELDSMARARARCTARPDSSDRVLCHVLCTTRRVRAAAKAACMSATAPTQAARRRRARGPP